MLPDDISRCTGAGHGLCETCRRTEPSDSPRQSFIEPAILIAFFKGGSAIECPNHYPAAAPKER